MVELVGAPRLASAFNDIDSVKKACGVFRDVHATLQEAIGTVIVGQTQVVEEVLLAIFADGHVLLEGVPGLGKTLLVETLGRTLSLPYARIQFTPDVMPADITGTNIVLEDERTGRRRFAFRQGPIFNQVILADEINRATPKSQSALLEAMQERSVSVGGTTHHLERPFFVLATQNPIEQEGTYALPEAQLDRFLFKVAVPFTTQSEMNTILTRTTAGRIVPPEAIIDGTYLQQAQALARHIVIAPHVQDYAIRLVLATHPGSPHAPEEAVHRITIGGSPRAAQAIVSAARVFALTQGRFAVSFADIGRIAAPAPRHRIVRSFEAEAEEITTDDIITDLLDFVPHEQTGERTTTHG